MSCGIGTRPSYRYTPILSARAHPSYQRAPIHSLHDCLQVTFTHSILSTNKSRTRRIRATTSQLTVRLPLLLAMSHCPRCKQQVTRITANTCDACKDLLCRGCNRKHVKSEGKRQCEQCIERDRKRREKGRVIRRTCIENPSLRRAYCTKCKRVRETNRFCRLPRPDPDGNEYERSCLSCLKKLNPTAAAPLGAPTATHEASHAPLIEHDPNSAGPQRPVSQEECSSSYQDSEEISTAGSTDNNTDGSSNAARWTLGDALRFDYTSRIFQLTDEIREVVDAPSRTSEKFGLLLPHYKEFLRIYNYHNGCNGFYAPMATFGKNYFLEQHGFDLPGDAELKHLHDNTTAQVLCASTDQLRIAMRSGVGLPDIPCIYIPKEEQAVQRTMDNFIEELQGWKHAKLEYQRFSPYMRDEPRRVNGQKKRKTSGHMSSTVQFSGYFRIQARISSSATSA
ncbi:hypothetical protein EJ07DRAFT_160342 [Lizonia empirigonia]|nr:hypothetical protein EJ07DRAFT_160342 [Lizonia empirigonia]